MSRESCISCVLAFLVSFFVTPWVRKIAFSIGAVDIPKDERRVHKKPMARIGGLAIIISIVITLLINIGFDKSSILWSFDIGNKAWGIVLGCSIVVIMGILDDIKPKGAKLKLFFQVIAALMVVLLSDVRVRAISNPFSESGVLILNYYVSCLVTTVWIVGITNAINLIDGLDGLAAGVSTISYISIFFVSMILRDARTSMMAIVMAGAVLGFLPYNFNPAKIFMGDTGSTFLGFTLAIISVSGRLKAYTAISIVIPVLILGVPLFDTTFAILRRLFSGRPIMEADRGHIHHKLMDRGLSQRQVVLLMYLMSAVLGVSAIWITEIRHISILIAVVIFLVILLAVSKLVADVLKIRHNDKK
ncbi:MAG: undecaprenyl/decaprenyl-phosphate alpha-N-acetylglucosaminyl 1-phosphate transferase [Clostridiales bacterium]|nr:undecaprenyl/decaprenyl-phosphate alpha-N-acetylglucosaminyl 1-phosphate transferase [Clostridiales bacterium]